MRWCCSAAALSTDIFSSSYARMGQLFRFNPTSAGRMIALDPLFQYIGAKWSYIPSSMAGVSPRSAMCWRGLDRRQHHRYKAVGRSRASGSWSWSGRRRGCGPGPVKRRRWWADLCSSSTARGGHNDLLMLLALVAPCTRSCSTASARRRAHGAGARDQADRRPAAAVCHRCRGPRAAAGDAMTAGRRRCCAGPPGLTQLRHVRPRVINLFATCSRARARATA